MSTNTSSTPASTRVPAGPSLRAAQVLSTLTLLVILGLGVTGGQLVDAGMGAIDVHSASAIALHVVSGLAVLALVAYRLSGATTAWWPVAVAVVVFGYSFVQAYLGSHDEIALHVPGALLLTGGSAWVAAWSFLHRRGTPVG